MGQWILCLLMLASARPFPSYEKEIEEKNVVEENKVQENQKTFFSVINQKAQEVLKYIRTQKDQFVQTQSLQKKELEKKMQDSIAQARQKTPDVDMQKVRKQINEERQSALKEMQKVRKEFEAELDSEKKRFDLFVKQQKENFQSKVKTLSQQVKSFMQLEQKKAQEENEFQQIPKGPGAVLAPGKEP